MAIRKDTFSQQVFDHVVESIRSGKLSPGDRVTEQMLVDRLGISHAPVREALQALTREGLIVTHPHKGRQIKSFSFREIIETAFIAGALEGALAVLALRYSKEKQLSRLQDIVNEMDRVGYGVDSLLKLETLGSEFHYVICGQDNLSAMAVYVRKLCSNMTKLLYYKYWKTIYTPMEIVDRHKYVLDVIISGNSEQIESAIRQHHNEVGKRLCECLVNLGVLELM